MKDVKKAKLILLDHIQTGKSITVSRATEIYELLGGDGKRGPNPSIKKTTGVNARKLRALEEYIILREETGMKKTPAMDTIAERYDVDRRTFERWFDVLWMLPYVKKRHDKN